MQASSAQVIEHMASKQKNAIKRLMFDFEELQKSPVANVSAAPLDENALEWHCNIRQDETIYHLILFFPDNYPYSSPSAEFVPNGFRYTGGATKPGKKGTQVCLNIFSDFAYIHTEWADQKGLGWSPGYTVQTVLMNVIAFLAETSSHLNLGLSKSFSCSDCGHTYKKPFPAFNEDEGETSKPTGKKGKGVGKSSKGKESSKTNDSSKASSPEKGPQIIDYISKDVFTTKKVTSIDDLFGYGLVVSGPSHRPSLTTPCEFLTGKSYYGMKKAVNVVHSVLKESLSVFLPMYIHPNHGSGIQTEFENCLKAVAQILPSCKKASQCEMIIKTIPNLMSATVVEFSKGTQHTSDNSLNGYFALHRLLFWALETFPELQGIVESRLERFIESEDNRTKKACPHIGELLMLLAASQKYKWQDLADAYLSESFRRNVMWYVKEDSKLGFLDTDKDYRMKETLTRTLVSRKLLAFQVLFQDIAMPKGMSRKDIIKRYDDNMGFPSEEMVNQMKAACNKINNEMKTYADWFKILKLPVPAEDELFTRFVEAVRFSILTDGYNWSFWKTGGGWGEVLRKYADMKKEHKEKKAAEKAGEEKKGGAKKAGEKSKKKEETPMEVDEEEKSALTKSKKAGKTASPARGKAAARGRKRKIDEDDDQVDDENDDSDPPPAKTAKGAKAKAARGRGRGRGASKK